MRRITSLLLLCVLAAPLGAQRAVANAALNVRESQSKSSKILDHLSAGDTVALITEKPTLSYYHIEEPNGTKGWVYMRYVDLVGAGAAATSPPPPVTAPAPAPAPAPGKTSAAAANAVSASWEKPLPNSAVFHRSGFADCGPGGQGGDSLTNVRKNRTDEPATYHPVLFDAILAVPYPKNHKPQRSGWSAADLGVIAPFEGVGVSVTGFVVETTPRVRAHGHPWTPDMLAGAVTARDSVRVSGWLMYDPEHFAQTTNYDPAQPSNGLHVRATLWEIHPITKIEVFDPATRTWHAIP
jgi:hypothetical protein